jgi:hypothetical protein
MIQNIIMLTHPANGRVFFACFKPETTHTLKLLPAYKAGLRDHILNFINSCGVTAATEYD